MKKLIYSLAIVLLGMTSCTSFDDEHSVNYGDGPAVSIDLTTTTDSTFTFSVNPAEGTQYYAYTVLQGDEAQDVSESSVLKKGLGGISEEVVKYADAQSVTVDMRNAKKQPLCLPNTSYVIYAVAANDKGVTGLVKSKVVKTTDGKAPVMEPYKAEDPTDANDTITTVAFSENVAAGEGTVSASYLQEWGDGEPIAIPAEDLNVAINGNKVSFSVKNVPAGAYVLYSWTEGAFVDSFGNKCPATTTQITEESIAGVYKRLPFKTWDITADNFNGKAGTLIPDYQAFKGSLTFDHDIYRNDEEVKTGDVSVIYSNSTKTSTIALNVNQWSVYGKTLTFILPEKPAAGDIITVSFKANVVTDINGNGNNAFTSTTKTMWWKYFAMTKDMALGNFDFSFSTDKGTYHKGTVTISEDSENANGLIIKNLFLNDSEVGGSYDLNAGIVYIDAYNALGLVDDGEGGFYGLITYSLSGNKKIAFTVNPDGTLTSTDFGIVACDENYEEALGWWVKANTTTLTPSKDSSKARAFAAKKSYKKSSIKKVNVKVNARSLRTIKK